VELLVGNGREEAEGSSRERRLGKETGERVEETHSTTFGAMTLHGPHQVAKQSMTITPGSLSAFWYSAMLYQTPMLAEFLHQSSCMQSIECN